jgi:hypothetical protein
MMKKRPARRVWALAFGHHEDHTRRHAYEPTREAAMAAFRQELAAGVTMAQRATTELTGDPVLRRDWHQSRRHRQKLEAG